MCDCSYMFFYYPRNKRKRKEKKKLNKIDKNKIKSKYKCSSILYIMLAWRYTRYKSSIQSI